jgi:hypothetical protein
MLLAEANQWPEDVRPYFGDGDECHMAFHFPLMPRMFMALRQEDRHPIVEILEQTPDIPENCQWAMFLRNHDELTLEMVTDEERDYMYRPTPPIRRCAINVGIRRRLAPLLENSRRRIELLNALLFSLPGTPVIYYGDEIGMGDNIYLGDRNGVRTPMQWSGDRNAGFSRADPARLYAPPIMDPGLRLPGDQRRGAGALAVLAAQLDEAADRAAQAAPRLRPRHGHGGGGAADRDALGRLFRAPRGGRRSRRRAARAGARDGSRAVQHLAGVRRPAGDEDLPQAGGGDQPRPGGDALPGGARRLPPASRAGRVDRLHFGGGRRVRGGRRLRVRGQPGRRLERGAEGARPLPAGAAAAAPPTPRR